MKISRLLPLAAGLGLALASSPAAASCAMPPALGEHLAMADAVFVGTVMELSDADRTAVVRVEEIWRGPALTETVEVFGGPDDAGTFTSVDRTYLAGGRYLFAVDISDGALRDNACSATQEWTPDLADLRPTTVSQPTAPDEEADAGSLPLGPMVAGAAVLVLAAGSVLAFRARR